MNEKILPDDIESKSLSELTDIADRLIQELESKKNLEESIDDYQYLIKLNNLIEKKFQKDSKNISESTKLKIEELTSKISLDLIFFPPGNKPYLIGIIRSVFFCFAK